MKILFVNPFFLKKSTMEQEWMMPYFPLGLLYLAAVSREAGHDVAVFDGTFESGDVDFQAALMLHQPQVVCFASLITLRPMALHLAKIARDYGAEVIFGGPDPSQEPAVYLEDTAVVVRGEGERTLLDLVANLDGDLSKVPGIAYLADGKMIRTAEREPIMKLDELPLPARDLIDAKPYLDAWQDAHGYTSMTLAASRGCPYGCEYCQSYTTAIHFRQRSLVNVVDEMKYLESTYRPDRFRLVDDLSGLGADWLRDLGLAMQAAGVTTPYEGLRFYDLPADLPMFEAGKMLCGRRNLVVTPLNDHPHAPPRHTSEQLQKRWGAGILD
jgi:anaerobic magnesium-protoporphyrin IX monomethyl ester cyclase